MNPVSRFIENQPAIKMLALIFLLFVGLALMGEGLDIQAPKGHIFFATAFPF